MPKLRPSSRSKATTRKPNVTGKICASKSGPAKFQEPKSGTKTTVSTGNHGTFDLSNISSRLRQRNIVFSGRKSEATSILDQKNTITSQLAKTKRKKTDAIPVDPYAFETLVDSDEKENIDPKESHRGRKKLPVQRRNLREKPLHPGKLSTRSSDLVVQGAGSSPVHVVQAVLTSDAPAVAALPSVRFIKQPQLSAAPIISRNLLSSTPASTLPVAAKPLQSIIPSPVFSPVGTLSASPSIAVKDLEPYELNPRHSAIILEPFQDEKLDSDGSRRSDSKERSASRSASRSSRKMSESEHEDAYMSWLEDFNAQLDRYASHELTIEENRSK